MANGKVDDIPWSQLRQRRSVPQFVVDAIPPEDMQAFLRLVATNPFSPFAEATAVRGKIFSLRQWRTEAANPNTVTKEFSALRQVGKRRRDSDAAANGKHTSTNDFETDSEDEQRKKKQRRSSRPALTTSVPKSSEVLLNESETSPKIGPEYQAEVPKSTMSREYWKDNHIKVSSERVFAEEGVQGARAVDTFLQDLNKELEKRDGYGLAPFTLELALKTFFKYRSKPSTAKKAALGQIPSGPYFPGIKGKFNYEEQCLFVRTLAERAKNFLQISREVLPNRTPSELVWMYYTRHKQLWIQNGGMKDGQVLDDGGEKLKRVPLTVERTVSALRSLAITAGDGFPIDSRVNLAVLACRRGNLARRRREREEENMKKVSRLRSQAS